MIHQSVIKIVIKDLLLERKIDSSSGTTEGYTKILMSAERPKGESHILKVPQCEILWDWKWVNNHSPMGHYFFLKKFKEDPKKKIDDFVSKSLGFDVCVS